MAKVKETYSGPRLEKLLANLPWDLRAKSLGKAAKAGGGVVARAARKRVPVGDPKHNPGAKALKKTITHTVRYYDNDRRAVAVVGARYPEGAHVHLVEKGHKVLVSKGPRYKQPPLSGSARVEGKAFLVPAADGTKRQQQAAVLNRLRELIKKAEKDARA